jgi:hypothetical protein
MPFPKTTQTINEVIPSLDGGVNSRKVAWVLDRNEMADAINIDISNIGKWSRRLGTVSRGGTENSPGGMHWHRDADSDIVLWAIWGSVLYRSTGGGAWVDRASGASFYQDVLHQFVEGTYNNANFVDNQLRAVYGCQCVPNSNTTLATELFVFKGDEVGNANTYSQNESHAPRCLEYFQGRLWKGWDRVSGDGNDLAWSELDDGLTYSPANELSIEPGIGGKIVGLRAGRGAVPQLFVFKEEAIAVLEPRWGSSSALIPGLGDELDTIASRVQLLTSGVGCVATKSLTSAPGFAGGDILFLARDGVRSLSRASDDTVAGAGPRITEKVPGWIDRINWQAAHKAVASIFDDAYHLALPLDGSIENNAVLRMQLNNGAWTLHDWVCRDITRVPFNSEEQFWFQNNAAYTQESTQTGLPDQPIYHMYKGYTGDRDPNDAFIDYTMQTRGLNFQSPNNEKQWDRIMFLGTVDANETHALTVAYRVDIQDWETAASSIVFGVPGNIITMGDTPLVWEAPTTKMVQRRLGLQDVAPGTMIEFRFMGSSDEARPEFYHVDVAATPQQEIFDNSR